VVEREMITILGVAEILGGTVAILVIGFVVWKVINAAIGGGQSPFTSPLFRDGKPGRYEYKHLGSHEDPRVSMSGRMLPGCRTVHEFQANDSREIREKFFGQTTPAGNVTRVYTRVGRGRWDVSYENWDTPIGNGKDISLKEYQEMEHPKLTGKKKWRGW
jgi:hypothetical protein